MSAPHSELLRTFEAAQQSVKTKKAVGNDVLLHLYALFKQATVGDISGDRPGMMDFKGRAKYDAWSARKGITKEQAQRDYVDLVASLP